MIYSLLGDTPASYLKNIKKIGISASEDDSGNIISKTVKVIEQPSDASSEFPSSGVDNDFTADSYKSEAPDNQDYSAVEMPSGAVRISSNRPEETIAADIVDIDETHYDNELSNNLLLQQYDDSKYSSSNPEETIVDDIAYADKKYESNGMSEEEIDNVLRKESEKPDYLKKDNTTNAFASLRKDTRVRLTAMPGNETKVYGYRSQDNILGIFYDTNGLLFPYTPSITESHNTEYQQSSLVHSNQDYYAYKTTGSVKINLSGSFYVQNDYQAKYMLAVIHFMRVISKSHFGKRDTKAGTPPPLLCLSGYGKYMYDQLPVIVDSHDLSYKQDVQYVDVVDTAGNLTKVPQELDITLNLIVQNSPKRWREDFNLDEFRTGELLRKQTGWI